MPDLHLQQVTLVVALPYVTRAQLTVVGVVLADIPFICILHKLVLYNIYIYAYNTHTRTHAHAHTHAHHTHTAARASYLFSSLADRLGSTSDLQPGSSTLCGSRLSVV